MQNRICPHCGRSSAVVTTACNNQPGDAPQGSALSLLIAVAIIAGVAFAVYRWLLAP